MKKTYFPISGLFTNQHPLNFSRGTWIEAQEITPNFCALPTDEIGIFSCPVWMKSQSVNSPSSVITPPASIILGFHEEISVFNTPHILLRWSPAKKGCLSASRAVNRSDGSYFRSPCNRCIRSPAEWSTCCIIRFWSRGSFRTAFILSLEAAPSGQSNFPLLTYFSAWRSAFFNMWWGRGPSTLSIMARCSKFSWVWNSASPEHNSTKIQPTLQTSQG